MVQLPLQATVAGQEGRSHLGHQLLEGIGLDVLAVGQGPAAPARMPGPVRELMQGRAVVPLEIHKKLDRRHLDQVQAGAVEGPAAAMLDHGARARQQRLRGRISVTLRLRSLRPDQVGG